MKIRNGFVSNSSSSSFAIVGTRFKKTIENCEKICKEHLSEEYDIADYTEKMCCNKELVNKFCPDCGKKNEDIEETINWIDLFNDFQYDLDVDVNDNGYGDIIIGKSLSIDLEGSRQDVDKLIKELQDAKVIVEKLDLGKVEFHCGITNN